MKSRKYKDVEVGDVYGKLTVIKKANDARLCKDIKWECQCECGNRTIVDEMNLKTGTTKSCGCMRSDVTTQLKTKHGYRHTRLYAIWCGIKSRCNNKNRKNYHRYGGAGIALCGEWNDFENFKRWSEENGYADNLTIDRIDFTKGYSPDNCRWTDIITQANNTRRNIYITYHNETHTLMEWAKMFNVEYSALKKRYDSGWSVEDMFERPYKTGSKTLKRQQEKEMGIIA